jgi:hypothetical protein
MGAEQVGLEGDAVAIAAGQLQHRFDSLIQQAATDGQAAHAHHSAAAIGDIDRMHKAAQGAGHGQGGGQIAAPGRHHLSSDGKAAGLQNLL